jgi:hypothetical protein
MKAALRKGNASTLNVYIAKPVAGILGFAEFPTDYANAPDLDGIVLHYGTLPGGSNKRFNLGKTLGIFSISYWFSA